MSVDANFVEVGKNIAFTDSKHKKPEKPSEFYLLKFGGLFS